MGAVQQRSQCHGGAELFSKIVSPHKGLINALGEKRENDRTNFKKMTMIRFLKGLGKKREEDELKKKIGRCCVLL